MARIAVIGSGAIGQFYGAQFILGGHDVRLLLRRDYARVAREGLHVRQAPTPDIASTARHRELHFPPTAFRACAEAAQCAADGPVDWVLLAIKTTGLADAEALLRPVVGPRTGVVALTNGLGTEDRLAAWFTPAQVFGAMCRVSITRLDSGVVDHMAHGEVLLGHFLDDVAALAPLVELFASAGIVTRQPACLLEARWRKQMWNVVFNGLCVALGPNGRTTDHLMADPELIEMSRAIMLEVVEVANADLRAAGKSAHIDSGPSVDEQIHRTASMGAFQPSTLVDYRLGRPMEVEAIWGEAVRRARRLGVSAPRIELLHALVRDRARR